MTPSPILRSKRIRLNAIVEADFPRIAAWNDDGVFPRLFSGRVAEPIYMDDLKKWFKESRESPNDFTFAIRRMLSDDIIGLAGIDGVQWNHRNGALFIGIGDHEQRGKGYGRETITLLLQFGFHELNLHRIFLSVFSYNTNAIGLYESMGFIKEAVYRQHVRRDGQWHDMYIYGMLVHEWEARYLTPSE
jgi:RimJ/RimL family protein N-acetyltransferase